MIAPIAVSFVISTHNRKNVLLSTLRHVRQCGLVVDNYEIIVIDNASTDGTSEALRQTFPNVHVLPMTENLGSCAKNFGIAIARGKYIVFLDDDSYPQPGSIARMIRHFEADPQLGAATFTISLPDGSHECSAYPDVFIGCGVGLRRRALQQTGGLPDDFFMQAEEYDLSLRLLDAGWTVQTFDDLHVTHLKTPQSRRSSRTMRLDVRNNVLLALRRFPSNWKMPFLRDWLVRYFAIARANDQRVAFALGLLQGMMRFRTETPVSEQTFERFTRLKQIEQTLRQARDEHGLSRVLFVDWGKNIFPYYLAAKKIGLTIVAIADPRLATLKLSYRGIPVINDEAALQLDFDAAVISNSSPVHAARRRAQWRWRDDRPVIDVLELEKQLTAVRPAAWGSRRTAARSA